MITFFRAFLKSCPRCHVNSLMKMYPFLWYNNLMIRKEDIALTTHPTEHFYETKGTAYLGSVENGTLKINDEGVTFTYKNPRRGQPLVFSWEDILQAEVDVKMNGKLGQQFALILRTQAKVRFGSKEAGHLVKMISERIGKENVVRAPSILDPLRRAIRKS